MSSMATACGAHDPHHHLLEFHCLRCDEHDHGAEDDDDINDDGVEELFFTQK